MAKYDYHCRECLEWYEVERSIHAVEEPVSCVKCEQPMRRVYGPVGTVLKGDGFYKNDSARKIKNFYPENGDSV